MAIGSTTHQAVEVNVKVFPNLKLRVCIANKNKKSYVHVLVIHCGLGCTFGGPGFGYPLWPKFWDKLPTLRPVFTRFSKFCAETQ